MEFFTVFPGSSQQLLPSDMPLIGKQKLKKCPKLGPLTLIWKCLEQWNVAVGVDEGKSARSADQCRAILMTGSEYLVEQENFKLEWYLTIDSRGHYSTI